MSTESEEDFKDRTYREAIAAGLSHEVATFLKANVTSTSEARKRTANELRAIDEGFAALKLPVVLAARAMRSGIDPRGRLRDLVLGAHGLRRAEVANTSRAYWKGRK